MRRPWRGPDFDSRTNIIVTKAKLQGLAIVGSEAFSQSESIEARPVQPDDSIYGRLLSRCGVAAGRAGDHRRAVLKVHCAGHNLPPASKCRLLLKFLQAHDSTPGCDLSREGLGTTWLSGEKS
jgi:hypothetical protein